MSQIASEVGEVICGLKTILDSLRMTLRGAAVTREFGLDDAMKKRRAIVAVKTKGESLSNMAIAVRDNYEEK
jgi:hypothetical protein